MPSNALSYKPWHEQKKHDISNDKRGFAHVNPLKTFHFIFTPFCFVKINETVIKMLYKVTVGRTALWLKLRVSSFFLPQTWSLFFRCITRIQTEPLKTLNNTSKYVNYSFQMKSDIFNTHLGCFTHYGHFAYVLQILLDISVIFLSLLHIFYPFIPKMYTWPSPEICFSADLITKQAFLYIKPGVVETAPNDHKKADWFILFLIFKMSLCCNEVHSVQRNGWLKLSRNIMLNTNNKVRKTKWNKHKWCDNKATK